MKGKRVSMQTIADMLNISKVTVFKAINNQPGVSEELRKKIIKLCNELGYDKWAGNSSKSSCNLAYIVPKRYFLENENFYSSIYYYLNKECQREKIQLSLYIIDAHSEENCILPSQVQASHFNGLLIGGELNFPFLHALAKTKIPMVFIDFYISGFKSDCIVVDNYYVGYVATNYLVEKGHRDIGFLGDPKQTTSISDRFFGYRKALFSHDLQYNKNWQIVNNDKITGYYHLDFDLPDKLPTAFICHCDMAAYFLMQKLSAYKIKVPDDVSIISFDNTQLSQDCNPPLTTIDISKKEFAKKALSQMKTRLSEPNLPYQRGYIHTSLIERASVKDLTK
ncbi:MAG: LacI family transcriptional regulator [Clostridiaceae bacterium]|jgi:LacI family transcriptional regulator|nr:LacI family transcriptional regulator [Clostridiaceae bacterium]